MIPSISMVHVDELLTNVSIAYENANFVANVLSPDLPVNKQSNKYPVFDLSHFRTVDDRRAPGAEANQMPAWNLSKNSYFCDGHALCDFIDDTTRANADEATDIDVQTTEGISETMMLNREVALQQLVFGGGSTVPQAALSGTSKWSDFVNSNPILAIDEQKVAIQKASTKSPNKLMLSYDVFSQVRNHPAVIDRVKYTQRADQLNEQDLAAAFGVDQVVVAKALVQTVNEGQANALDYIWKNSALLFYVPPAIGLRTISLLAGFMWTYGVPKNQGRLVKRYREERRTSDVIENQWYYDDEIIVPGAGFGWTAVV